MGKPTTLIIVEKVYFMNRINMYFIIIVLIMVEGITLFGQENIITEKNQPKVLKAIAPTFIPFVFDETGVAEVVVEVKLNNEGKVISAKTIFASLFQDISFENTAKQWMFEDSLSKDERIAHIKFVLRIMPKGTSQSELTTIYRYPSEIEIRDLVFPSQITTGPLPDKEKPPKKESKP
jgi:hypothetical protein